MRPELSAFGRRWSAFRVLGAIGLLVSLVAGFLLGSRFGLSLMVLAQMSVLAVATFFTLHELMWRRTGRLVYYQHQNSILAVITVFLLLAGQPVIANLDVAVTCIGIFLMVGRVGCFMVGCCHGMPSVHGVAYGAQHVRRGFAPHFEGVRLFPIQLLEFFLVLIAVAICAMLIAPGSTPGRALSAYVVLYGFGRFLLEFLRGDLHRSYRAGFSQGQWTSVGLMSGVVIAEYAGVLPFALWQIVLLAVVLLFMLVIIITHAIRKTDAHLLSHARHINEIAILIADLRQRCDAPGTDTYVGSTSLGINLSMHNTKADKDSERVFTVSRAGAVLSREDAGTIAKWLACLSGFRGKPSLRFRENGIVHVFLTQQTASNDEELESDGFNFARISILPTKEPASDKSSEDLAIGKNAVRSKSQSSG